MTVTKATTTNRRKLRVDMFFTNITINVFELKRNNFSKVFLIVVVLAKISYLYKIKIKK